MSGYVVAQRQTALTERDLLGNATFFSRGLKSLVLRDLLVYAGILRPGAEPKICYYEDSDGLKVDFVLLFEDGRWAMANAEIGEAQVKGSVKRLERLRKKVRVAGRLGEPAFSAVITATTSHPHQDTQTGTYVFPITSLTA